MSLLLEPNLVSTIIPVYNRPEMVKEAVASVLAQTHKPIEVLLVDDGSTDHTPAVLQALALRHEQVKVFTQKNSGPGAARELGRLNSRGEYIQYLDSDDLLLPDKFQQQIAALARQPEADVAYGKTESISVDAQPQKVADPKTGEHHKSMFPLMLRERWWSTSTPLFRRAAVEQAGPWSPLSNEEDWEYDCRIASFGGRLAYTDTFVSITRRHADHLSVDGGTSPEKLRHRAWSRAKIFQHGKQYMSLENRPTEILSEDWEFFSKYAFLLARQCALAGLTTEARAMTSISIEARGKKSMQHLVFLKLVKFLGWRRAANVVQRMGR